MIALTPEGDAPDKPRRPGTVQPAGGGLALAMDRSMQMLQVQAMMASRFPRDEAQRERRVLQECKLPAIAEGAVYEYVVGGNEVRGASIRFVEAVARIWGNFVSAVEELDRGDGYSDCVAYAMDLETRYYDHRIFRVRHWRDTKGGGYPLRDEREISDHIGNIGQRRKRRVMLAVLPPQLIADGLAQCEQTVKARADLSPEGFAKVLESFAGFGVTRAQIEKFLQRKVEAMTATQWARLRDIYVNLRDGIAQVGDVFEPVQPEGAGADADLKGGPAGVREVVTATQRAKEKVRERRMRPPVPDPFPPQDEGAGDPGAGTGPEVSLGALREALVAALTQDDADLVLDAARVLPPEAQQALRILYDQRFGEPDA